ncbi:MAG: hypothetical protein IPP96_17935 [Chitinophagaceae bacterium]|nr:hypothetical protein [Chitinophagaceae bacterium]
MKILFSILFFSFSVCVMAQRGVGLTEKEMKDLVGNWTGTMVYTGYSNEKSQVTFTARLEIVDMKDSLVFNFIFTDPGGKQLVEKNSFRIYEDGNRLSFDSAQFDIVDTRRRGIRVTIIAERLGVENFRSADFQEIINFGPGILNYTKGIRYMDMSDAYFIRKRVTLTKTK